MEQTERELKEIEGDGTPCAGCICPDCKHYLDVKCSGCSDDCRHYTVQCVKFKKDAES